VLRLLAEAETQFPEDRLDQHLVSGNASVRRAALRCLATDRDNDELRALLDRLAPTTPRFYDVVGILDRLEHGPSFARGRAAAILAET
jgi:hypothetical protein